MLVMTLLWTSLAALVATVILSVARHTTFNSDRSFASHIVVTGVLIALNAFALYRRSLTGAHMSSDEVVLAMVTVGLAVALFASIAMWGRVVARMRGRADATASLEQYYRALFQQSGAIVLVSDPKTREIVDANDAAAAYYGYPLAHLRTMRLTAINPMSVAEIERETLLADAEGRRFHRLRQTVLGGEVREVEAYGSRVTIGGREVQVEVIHDVTDRVIAERALAMERRMLERRVEERTAELEATVQRLEEANDSKDRFLANINHELRTPLNSIIGYTGLVLGGLTGEIPVESAKQLRFVDRSGRHLLGLVNDLLDVAQFEHDGVRIEPSQFDLGALLSEVGGIAAPLADEKGLRLDVLPAASGIGMHTDRVRVEQILLNLVSNAIKFTERGAVSMAAQIHPDGMVSMIVTDTGVGMPAHAIAAVTEAFEQIYGDDGMKPAGIGIGLAISKRLAEALGGTLRVTSAQDVGTSFTLEVPCIYQAADEDLGLPS